MSRINVKGSRVLITGAANGIGRSLALQLTSMGAHVALIDINEKALRSVSEACGDALYRQCDITNKVQLREAINSLAGSFQAFDVVIANAGIAFEEPLINDKEDDDFERTINTNVFGTHFTVKAVEKHMSDNSYILVTSSLGADVNFPLMGGYSVSKAAVASYGQTLKIELRGTGTRVGTAFYSQLDNEMTTKFNSPAAQWLLNRRGLQLLHRVVPEQVAIDAVIRGIQRRSAIVVAPRRVRIIRWYRSPIQFVVGRWFGNVQEGIRISLMSSK
ncbi:SDR family NAD(P)-dependent oxidoreductase [Candidatus Saccharibacteria bacterium]|nr:SDR family NAD(P)-dependent oxidoreductase [Candidatus Saccharibacteria bacterium]